MKLEADSSSDKDSQAGSALRRELLSILFMYAALAVLPFLTGFACSGSL